MTQQPYYPPQYPQAPQPQVQQPYAPPAPPVPQQPYAAPVPQGYPAPGGYPQAAPQPPAQPLAAGTLDAFYNQPSVGGGPSLSWTDKQTNQPKPIGTSYTGVVARDVTNADVQQQTDFRTQAPLFYKDGRPKFAMKVPLKLQPSAEFPDGEASWFVKGQARDELVRAMAEAGCEGSPKAGAVITVTLVQRRNTGAGMNPANIVQVQYTPPGGQPGQAPAPQPVAEQAPPVAEQAPPVQQVQEQPQYAAPQAAPVQQYAPPAPVQQVTEQPQYAAPQASIQQTAPQPPANLSPEQQALLAQLTNQQAAGQ